MSEDMNDEVTIPVTCAVCGKVTERTIFKKYLFKYRLNGDGTYTRLAGSSCSRCAVVLEGKTVDATVETRQPPAPGTEKPVYVREEHGLFIATADGGLVSIGSQNEENTDVWLFSHYPEAQQISSPQEVFDIANERFDRYHPEFVKKQAQGEA